MVFFFLPLSVHGGSVSGGGSSSMEMALFGSVYAISATTASLVVVVSSSCGGSTSMVLF
ncbi:hypothetical protein TSUD_216090 [Trifolium subterraneum]|uniref:Uncharacterized protein n=1 Tax=Trifolium subterraneum TaxID=3900 RepID=A0A2Z6MUS9_TRISU|nr:hypothetical protein TSUD_216090 [Trifolium subterraneum]